MRLPRTKLTRDAILFAAGLAGLVHETVIAATERPTLIIAFLAMMGLPAFLRTDEKQSHDETSATEREDRDRS